MTMKIAWTLVVCLLAGIVIAPAAHGQSAAAGSLKGTVTDPSGGLTPGALVQARGMGTEYRARTDVSGQYAIPAMRPGKYTVRVLAKGFTLNQKEGVDVSGAATLDVQLSIQAESQVINVEAEANTVTTDPTQNGGALVLTQKELAALSDDPDELTQQLQAMAGPGAGPSGGQIYIDGFTGGNMPPKSSIREVRINSNPFSAEYDRPGFGRIEILTRPGTDKIRGQAFFQYNDQNFNTRSPLLAQSSLPPYSQKFYGFNLSGPIRKDKASFAVDFERRNIEENAFVYATTLDSSLNPKTINQSVSQPQTRMTVTPRVDYAINAKNNLTLRYQNTQVSQDNEGISGFSLPSKAFNTKSTENTLQATETSVLSTKAINETRFQFSRSTSQDTTKGNSPVVSVAGAFDDGSAQVGNSGSKSIRWEVTNITTYNRGAHTYKMGLRVKQASIDDTSVNNFNGTYSFFGGTGPALDANNRPIAGSTIDLTALERYRRTLLFGQLGYTGAQIRELGGGASQFSIGAGTQTSSVSQVDVGFFVNDDWRIKPNLTVSYGLRYEAQTNIGDHADWAPRVGIAWGVDARNGKAAKTVVRLGFGSFYDRISENTTLQTERFNGTTQQSYLLQNPDTYPAIPSLASLANSKQPQQIQSLYQGIVAPRTYQWSAGADRQINKYVRLSVNYIGSRGVHVSRSRNINTPVNGVYPYGNQQLLMLTESTGFTRSNMLILSPNVNYKKVFLFGFYGLSYGKSDSEGQPANPYNLKAEYGPSSFGDVRHRFLTGTNIPMPWKLSLNPFILISSGTPFNITTGRDTLRTGVPSQRPSLLSGVSAVACTGADLVYRSGYGCFNLNPAPGTEIERNYGRGPVNLSFNLRLSRTWSFGSRGESGSADGMPPGMGGVRGGGPGGGGPPPGGGGPGGGGPPPGLFGAASAKKYNLTLSASARNILNHPSYAPPSGDLSSPYFGQYRSLGGGFGPFGANTTYNRKIDLQLRFQF